MGVRRALAWVAMCAAATSACAALGGIEDLQFTSGAANDGAISADGPGNGDSATTNGDAGPNGDAGASTPPPPPTYCSSLGTKALCEDFEGAAVPPAGWATILPLYGVFGVVPGPLSPHAIRMSPSGPVLAGAPGGGIAVSHDVAFSANLTHIALAFRLAVDAANDGGSIASLALGGGQTLIIGVSSGLSLKKSISVNANRPSASTGIAGHVLTDGWNGWHSFAVAIARAGECTVQLDGTLVLTATFDALDSTSKTLRIGPVSTSFSAATTLLPEISFDDVVVTTN